MSKVIIFDIEATNLDADFGYVLCFGYKECRLTSDGLIEGPTKVLTIHDYPGERVTDDSKLMAKAHEVISEADVLVTYYGKEFDLKFLNTRMILSGLPPLPPLGESHLDLYYTVRNNFTLHSKRLGNVAEYLRCPIEKTQVKGNYWVEAMAGDPKALEYIKDHCYKDVEILYWLFLTLRPYIRKFPRVWPIDQEKCASCGHPMQRRGRHVRGANLYHRLWCPKCGRWDYLPLSKEEKRALLGATGGN
jgi:uncharacterized protein YprB with RNaseH-like and TPR domain